MREIKFRAWTNNTWINEGMLYDYQDKTYVEVMGFNNEDLPLMQFTGMYDKNGVGIYEGDLINSFQNYYEPTEVYYDNDLAMFVTTNFHSTLALTDSIDSKVEVLGNIYENPELLK